MWRAVARHRFGFAPELRRQTATRALQNRRPDLNFCSGTLFCNGKRILRLCRRPWRKASGFPRRLSNSPEATPQPEAQPQKIHGGSPESQRLSALCCGEAAQTNASSKIASSSRVWQLPYREGGLSEIADLILRQRLQECLANYVVRE